MTSRSAVTTNDSREFLHWDKSSFIVKPVQSDPDFGHFTSFHTLYVVLSSSRNKQQSLNYYRVFLPPFDCLVCLFFFSFFLNQHKYSL